MPWDFVALPPRKKAALIAMIDERIEAERRAEARAKMKRK